MLTVVGCCHLLDQHLHRCPAAVCRLIGRASAFPSATFLLAPRQHLNRPFSLPRRVGSSLAVRSVAFCVAQVIRYCISFDEGLQTVVTATRLETAAGDAAASVPGQ